MHVLRARRQRVRDLGEGEVVRGHEPDGAMPDEPAEHRLSAGSPVARIGAIEHFVEEEQQRRTSRREVDDCAQPCDLGVEAGGARLQRVLDAQRRAT